jgi:hypothetical protein
MSNATTLRISTRQLADAAYRALRVAGVPSGAAADAARDAVELERRRGRGLEVLDRILRTEAGHPLIASCEADGAGTSLDARGASALLLAVPLVALACERAPSLLAIRRLAHCAAVEPALARRAGAEHRQFVVTTADGTPVLRVGPVGNTIEGGWSASWTFPLDVRLSVEDTGTPTAAGRDASADGPLMVERRCWERLSDRAARYLV